MQQNTATNLCGIIDQEIQSLLTKGAIKKTHCKGLISPIFIRPKPSGGWRLILNLKGLNQYLLAPHFKMEGLKCLPYTVQPNSLLAKIDLKDAYLSVPVRPQSARLLQFKWRTKRYQYITMPFGLNIAPSIFTRIMKHPIRMLRTQGVSAIIYLDDILIAASDCNTIRLHIQWTTSLLIALGFIINWEKSVLNPAIEMTFLGIQINTEKMSLELPALSLNKIRAGCRKLLVTKKDTARNVAHLIGLMTHSKIAILPAPPYYRSLQYDLIKVITHGSYEQHVFLQEQTNLDLQWWVKESPSWNSAPILPMRISLEISSDASLHGWGAATDKDRAHGTWTLQETQLHINLLELRAAFFSLKIFAHQLINASVLIHIDNVTAIRFINKRGGTHSPLLCWEAINLWRWAMERNLSIQAEYIPGRENTIADALSREEEVDWSDWRLDLSLFLEITHHFAIQPAIDLFASRTNTQLPTYVSWKKDPNAWKINAFTLEWGNLWILYLFPPWILVGRTLTKIMTDQVSEAILIAPVWQTRPWWPLLMTMLTRVPVKLPLGPITITNPKGNRTQSPHGSTYYDGIHHIRTILANRGLSESAIEPILSSWRESTKKSYTSVWNKWRAWCSQRSINSLDPPIEQFVTYLSEIHLKGKSTSWVNTHRSAVSAIIGTHSNKSIGSHPLVSRLLRGIEAIQPKLPRYSHTWDVTTLLKALKSIPLNIKWLTLKTVTLIALTTASRCSELAKLNVNLISFQNDTAICQIDGSKTLRKEGNETNQFVFIS